MITEVSKDPKHQELAERLLVDACKDVGIDVKTVEHGGRDRECDYAWLCYIIDPSKDDYVAALTYQSAIDHLNLIDPNGFLRSVGSRLHVTVYEIEVADEAAIQIRGDDGTPIIVSPWMSDLAVAKVMFNYRTI